MNGSLCRWRFVMQGENQVYTIGIWLKTGPSFRTLVTHPPQFDPKVIDARTFELCCAIAIVRAVK